MQIVTIDLDSLVEDPANARTHGERNLAAIRESLERFGQVEPLLVREGTNVVLGGNGRLSVMRALGWKQASVVRFSGTDSEATALALALNRTAELADWNQAALAEAIESLQETDSLDGLGWTDNEIAKLLGTSLDDEVDEQTDEVEPEQDTPELTHVEQVPLYFRGTEKGDFLRLIEALQSPLGCDNVTDAVVAAVKLVARAQGLQ